MAVVLIVYPAANNTLCLSVAKCCFRNLLYLLVITSVSDIERCLATILVTHGYLARNYIGQCIDED